MLHIGAIGWGVRDLQRNIQFWFLALQYRLKRPPDADFAILISQEGQAGVQLSLNAAVTSDKPRRHHIDLFTQNQAVVERLFALGATRVGWRVEPDADYVVLANPDENTFRVVQIHP